MARIKQSDQDTHKLRNIEFNTAKLMNSALHFNILKDKCLSGYFYTIATGRLGYTEDDNLIFEIDLEDDSQQLKIRVVPTEALENLRQGSEE